MISFNADLSTIQGERIKTMETIKFYIQSYRNMCRIVSRDCRTCYKKYNTACISDMEILLSSMRFIKSDIDKHYGNDVFFEYVDMTYTE